MGVTQLRSAYMVRTTYVKERNLPDRLDFYSDSGSACLRALTICQRVKGITEANVYKITKITGRSDLQVDIHKCFKP